MGGHTRAHTAGEARKRRTGTVGCFGRRLLGVAGAGVTQADGFLVRMGAARCEQMPRGHDWELFTANRWRMCAIRLQTDAIWVRRCKMPLGKPQVWASPILGCPRNIVPMWQLFELKRDPSYPCGNCLHGWDARVQPSKQKLQTDGSWVRLDGAPCEKHLRIVPKRHQFARVGPAWTAKRYRRRKQMDLGYEWTALHANSWHMGTNITGHPSIDEACTCDSARVSRMGRTHVASVCIGIVHMRLLFVERDH